MQNLQHAQTRLGNATMDIIHVLKNNPSIKSAILFGSAARGDHDKHSDTDIALWVEEGFVLGEFKQWLLSEKNGGWAYVAVLPRKNSLSVYTENGMKIDFLIVKLDIFIVKMIRRKFLKFSYM